MLEKLSKFQENLMQNFSIKGILKGNNNKSNNVNKDNKIKSRVFNSKRSMT